MWSRKDRAKLMGMAGVVSLCIPLPLLAANFNGVSLAPPMRSEAIGTETTIGNVIRSIPSPETDYSHGLTYDGDYLWVSGAFSNMLYKVEPVDGTAVNSFNLDPHLRGLAWDGVNIWISYWSPEVFCKHDPNTGATIHCFDAPEGPPEGLTFDGTNLWVGGDNNLYKVNPATGSVISSIPAPESDPRGLAFDGQYLWVGFQNSNNIYQVNPNDGTIITSFSSPASIQQGLAFDGQYLWATGADNVIYQIDIGYSAPCEHDTVIAKLQEARAAVSALPLDAFKTKNMQHGFVNQIKTAIARVTRGKYAEALHLVRGGILVKTDGCELTGGMDKNDWLKDCANQETVYLLLQEAIECLESMI